MDKFQGKLTERKTLYRPLTEKDLEGIREIEVVICVSLSDLIHAKGLSGVNEIADDMITDGSGYMLVDISYWAAGYVTGQEGVVDGNVLLKVIANVEKL